MREKRFFYIVVPSDLITVWPLDIELLLWRLLLFTFVQRYVFPKLQASAAFPFRENQRHGTDGQTDRQTDWRGATLNVAYREGRSNK